MPDRTNHLLRSELAAEREAREKVEAAYHEGTSRLLAAERRTKRAERQLADIYRSDSAERRCVELEQAVHAAREALTAVWAYTRTKEGGTHERLGEACGADACVLCLAEETAREALQVIDKALEGRDA